MCNRRTIVVSTFCVYSSTLKLDHTENCFCNHPRETRDSVMHKIPTLRYLPLYCNAGMIRRNKPVTIAASQPKVCSDPCLLAHGTWKYATLKPPRVRKRLTRAEFSPCVVSSALSHFTIAGDISIPVVWGNNH